MGFKIVEISSLKISISIGPMITMKPFFNKLEKNSMLELTLVNLLMLELTLVNLLMIKLTHVNLLSC